MTPRLGINLDHIATLRQLRQTPYPDLLKAAQISEQAGADQITVHLREDRRHIQDQDVTVLKKHLKIPLNLEMALAEPIIRFALKLRPEWVCLVPEKRQEVTTEGGLDLTQTKKKTAAAIARLRKNKIKVSLFIEPHPKTVKLAHELGAHAVEIHTGRYATLTQKPKPNTAAVKKELKRTSEALLMARKLGMGPHAGHGIDYLNVRPLVDLIDPQGTQLIEEYNIGHSVICRAAMVGLESAIREMAALVKAP